MRPTRRGFLGMLAAAIALTPFATRPTEARTTTGSGVFDARTGREIVFEEVEASRVSLRYGPDGLESATEASTWGNLPPYFDWDVDPDAQVDWVDVEAQIDLVKARVVARRLEAERIHRSVIEIGLKRLGHVEVVPEGARVVNAVDGPEDERYASVRDLPREVFARLVKATQTPAGGGYWLASRGDWHWVIARPGPSHDLAYLEDRWAITAEANNLGVGLTPISIHARTMASDLERWKTQDYSVYRIPAEVAKLPNGMWESRLLPAPNRINAAQYQRLSPAARNFLVDAGNWTGPDPRPARKVTLPRLPFAAWEKTVKP